MKNISKENLMEEIKEKELTFQKYKPQTEPGCPLICRDEGIIYTIDQLAEILNSNSADELRKLLNENHITQVGHVFECHCNTSDIKRGFETGICYYFYSYLGVLKYLHTYSNIKKKLTKSNILPSETAKLQKELEQELAELDESFEYFKYVQFDIAKELKGYDKNFNVIEEVKALNIISTPEQIQHKVVFYLMCNMIYCLTYVFNFSDGFLLQKNPLAPAAVMSEHLIKQSYTILKSWSDEGLIRFLSKKKRGKTIYYFTFKECNDRLDKVLNTCFKVLHFACFSVSTFCNNEFIVN